MGSMCLSQQGVQQYTSHLKVVKEMEANCAIEGRDFPGEYYSAPKTICGRMLRNLQDMGNGLKQITRGDNPIQTDIGDVVTIMSSFNGEETKLEKVLLTGNFIAGVTDGYSEVTVRSPLGKAIFHALAGDEFSFQVEGHTTWGIVIGFEKYKELDTENVQSR